jgi:hypothetical protein
MANNVLAASTIVLIGLVTGVGDAQNSIVTQETAGAVQVDHIIVAVSNLQEGTRRIEEMTGVKPVYGGRHPGAGTQNALLALGPRLYLEILAPQTDVELPEEVAWLSDLDDLTPMGFAVSTADIPGTVEWIESRGYVTSDPASGSRSRPDGATLAWTTMDISDPAIAGAPFFIQWDANSAHPATTSPEGCSLRSLTVVTPEQTALARLFSMLKLEVAVTGGAAPEASYEIVLDCPSGTVSLK